MEQRLLILTANKMLGSSLLANFRRPGGGKDSVLLSTRPPQLIPIMILKNYDLMLHAVHFVLPTHIFDGRNVWAAHRYQDDCLVPLNAFKGNEAVLLKLSRLQVTVMIIVFAD